MLLEQSWRRAVVLAVREIRRLGLFGLTSSEISRYKQAILAEAAQNAAQSEQRNNEEILNEVFLISFQTNFVNSSFTIFAFIHLSVCS